MDSDWLKSAVKRRKREQKELASKKISLLKGKENIQNAAGQENGADEDDKVNDDTDPSVSF